MAAGRSNGKANYTNCSRTNCSQVKKVGSSNAVCALADSLLTGLGHINRALTYNQTGTST